MKLFMNICSTFIIFICILCISSRFINLKPIKCFGRFTKLQKDRKLEVFIASYLSKDKLEVMDYEDEKESKKSTILCDVVPIILTREVETSMTEEEIRYYNQLKTGKSNRNLFEVARIDVRDGCLYDNLPYKWNSSKSRKDFYNLLTQFQPLRLDEVAGNLSPMARTAMMIEEHLDADITDLIIEPSDVFDDGRVSLSGCIKMIRKGDQRMKDNSDNEDGNEKDDDSSVLCDCHLDEVVALSIALDKPIMMQEVLVDSLSEDAKLSLIDNDKSALLIEGPIFQGNVINQKSDQSSLSKEEEEKKQSVPLAWEIYDPKSFFQLSSIEKRAILRASGVKKLPKPRLGINELDQVLLDLMDDAVRGEIYRIQSRLPISPINSNSNTIGTSRQNVLAEMGDALEKGNMDAALRLREKFVAMTRLRADPTQAVGSYDRFLDQDDWYEEARRKAMAPKKKPTTE